MDDKIECNEKIAKALVLCGDLIQAYSKKPSIINVSDLMIRYGTSIPSNERQIGNYRLWSSNGHTDYINVSNSNGNTIIFGCRGTVGTSFYSIEPCFVLNTAMFFEVKSQDIGKYYFALREIQGLKNYATGAAQPQITIDNIKQAQLKIVDNDTLLTIINTLDYINLENKKLQQLKKLYLQKFFD